MDNNTFKITEDSSLASAHKKLSEEFVEWRINSSAEERFGQYILNKYGKDVTWPELYYNPSSSFCWRLIWNNFQQDGSIEPPQNEDI